MTKNIKEIVDATSPHHQEDQLQTSDAEHLQYKSELPTVCYEDAEKILGETTAVREQCLSDIYKWLKLNPKIIYHEDVKIILHFLRGTKFKMDKAKVKIEKYYKMRAERIEWFSDRNPFAPEIVELLDLGVFLPLKQKDKEGRQVFIIRIAAHNPKKHLQNNVFKVGKMLSDLVIHFDEAISIYGVVAIFDMTGVTLSHALQLPPAMIKRSVESWECYPTLTKKLEFINAPIYVNAFLNTFRFFMSDKMRSRVMVTRGQSSVECDSLPSDLGGQGESYQDLAHYWKQKAQEHSEWFRSDEKYKLDLN